jgi:hypothetical protein
MNKFCELSFFNFIVAVALTSYDLPDLIGCRSPRKIALIELIDQMSQLASKELIDEKLSFPRSVHSLKNISENLNIVSSNENISSVFEWCFE